MVQHGAALTRESGDASLAEAVASGRFERLEERMAALCRYAVKLTTAPHAMEHGDVEELRRAGLDDRGIVDANQVVSYFNYVNRVADGLGIELEQHWPEEIRKPRSYPLRP
ncbi:MAG: peroxidase [Actinomycetota bacterium]|nr:peroxidase [Actinomycetota bacterium]